MRSSFLSLLLAVVISTAAADLDVIDATKWAMDSPDPSMEHAVGFMNPAEVSFFWENVKGTNTLHGKIVSIVPDAEAPSWLAVGEYEGDFSPSANVFENSDWVVGNPTDGTVKKFHARGASDMAGATEAPVQNLAMYSLFQFPLGDGRTGTVVEFEKKMEDDVTDISIQEFCDMTFLWAEGKPGAGGGISAEKDMGAFILNLGSVAGRSGECSFTGRSGSDAGSPDSGASNSDAGSSTDSSDSGSSAATSSSGSSTDSALKDQWLSLHNTRRTAEFAEHGVSDVPLQWSEELAQSAQMYADQLIKLDGCQIKHHYKPNESDPDWKGGENLAMAWGTAGWVKNDPERALEGWYDSEKPLPFGQNGHYTQVAWKATKYVGCGMAIKSVDADNDCAIEACRYLKPGNCNVDANNWLSKMILDDSPCGSESFSESYV